MKDLKDIDRLCRLLGLIESYDTTYGLRNSLVLEAMYVADLLGYPVGIRYDADEPDWPVVYIELPTGQVSWHMPEHPNEWDGHTTEEKYGRTRQYRELYEYIVTT